tara:strand:- start:2064 stop:2879 length:816 start_codon:yes stop_codon:yes gene_type:complete
MINPVVIDRIKFDSNTLPIIAGPCVIESREHCLRMAESILEITQKLDLPYIFKSSYDKANRTSIKSFRGPGLEEGLQVLQDVKSEVGVPVLTDIHHPSQAARVAEVADIMQIPAFLCRQTDLLLAAGNSGRTINIKKGQFVAPWKMESIVQKIESTGNKNILLTERGTTFGYDNLVTDVRSISMMQKTGYPVIFDATHSAQVPGKSGGVTGGMREFIPVIARAATAAGCNGLFLEVHDNVNKAKSDAATQWPLDKLYDLLAVIKQIHNSLY